MDQVSLAGSFTAAESVLDWFAPYKELSNAEDDAAYEKVLGRLLTEWYVMGGSVSISTYNAFLRTFWSEFLLISLFFDVT